MTKWMDGDRPNWAQFNGVETESLIQNSNESRRLDENKSDDEWNDWKDWRKKMIENSKLEFKINSKIQIEIQNASDNPRQISLES